MKRPLLIAAIASGIAIAAGGAKAAEPAVTLTQGHGAASLALVTYDGPVRTGHYRGPVADKIHHRGAYGERAIRRHLRAQGYRGIEFLRARRGFVAVNAVGACGNLVRLRVNLHSFATHRVRILQHRYAPARPGCPHFRHGFRAHGGYGGGYDGYGGYSPAFDRGFGPGRGHGRKHGPHGARKYLEQEALYGHLRRAGYGRFRDFGFVDGKFCGYGHDRRGTRVRLEVDPYSGRILLAARVK